MNLRINKKLDKIIPLIVISSLIFGGVLWNSIKKHEMDNSTIYTEAKITSFIKVAGKVSYYRLKYTFTVSGKIYSGSEVVQYFECDETAIPGCKGATFNVYYAKENPENSELDLKEYNKYKYTKPAFTY